MATAPLNIANAGSRSGLRLQIDINKTECTDATDEAAGIKMLIHPQDEYPLVTTFGFSIAPGFLTQIALNGVYIKNLPDPYPSKCTNRPLKYSNVYTEPLCIDESEIGGNMGLLCGMSIITVIEFLEFGIIAAIQRFCRGKNNNVTNPINVSKTK
ncbi:acid-sensing ion channel 1C-like [Anneissia japonica]|uniref:acid-sensing ion channel 1C-like n=1 Tax=Anneissia japonica TaxID=1529436 RepID=UPI0014258D52|nr:acid-sensing ion channel 1C-like [Anneissia japonica]